MIAISGPNVAGTTTHATNHLDFASLEVLEEALRSYPGAIVAVSHDRAFLDAIGTHRRVRVRDGSVVET
jgi:ATP-binding cassette subfamily F protein 3